MHKISIKPVWTLLDEQGQNLSPRLLELLADVQERGTLAASCKASGASYRHAWSLIKQGEQQLGVPLLNMKQGRGSTLSPLAVKLAWVNHRIHARLTPMLDSLAAELESELTEWLKQESGVLKVHASHGFAVEKLMNTLMAAQHQIERRYMGSLESVASLFHGQCDLAGFHIPQGEFEAVALAHYRQWLDPEKSRLIHVATRRQGLMVAPGNPRNIRGVRDLAREDLRFINRQPNSGTRFLLECFLAQAGIATTAINGYEQSEFTHAAVAAYVASGMADVGMGVETPSRRFKLDFIPLATERYFMLCNVDRLQAPTMQVLLDTMQSFAFRQAVEELPGYSALQCGTVQTLKEAFPMMAA